MEAYYYLFGLTSVWLIFAAIQDIKTREVANWLNFSLIAFALSFRAFYSIVNGEAWFFLHGIIGFGLFFCLAYVMYYSRVFAGGDAKLLMGIGAVLPFEKMSDYFSLTLEFIFLLFFVGSVYSLIYSTRLAILNKDRFKNEYKKYKNVSYILFLFNLIIMFILRFVIDEFFLWLGLSVLLLLISFLYGYLRAIDVCMIKKTQASKLTEGDWLENDVRVNGKTIKKTVHGLTAAEIKLLRKYDKTVYIKEGIPFVPAFLISFLIMVFFWVILGHHFSELVAFWLQSL